ERDRLLSEKADLQDRLVRRQAEFDNFRRRAERERAELVEYANTETVRSLLPILDDFERALKVESADKEYARGMELIYQRLSDALKKLGDEPITCAGQLSDPQKRASYDRFGHQGLQGAGGFDPSAFQDFGDILGDLFGFGDLFGGNNRRGRSRVQRGEDLRYDLEIEFEDVMHGMSAEIQ